MKIKKKLFLGFGLLFTVVLIFGAVSLYYIAVISETANNTLKNNYRTLTFTRAMRSVLDEQDLPLTSRASGIFDQALKKQESNITEPGEKEATAGLRQSFGMLLDPSSGISQQHEAEKKIRSLLTKIDGLNMQAIAFKNDSMHATINRATFYLGGMVLITFLILFILIANFPGFILDPLERLKAGLQEISQKNYDARLDFRASDEFAQLAGAFNTVATKLGELEDANLGKVLAAENRIKTLIEETPDAIIGVNEKEEVLFVNATAKKIMDPGSQPVTGQPMSILSQQSGLLKEIRENKDPKGILKVKYEGKTIRFQQKNLEITIPHLKIDFDSLQTASTSAGTIYVLKEVHE
jgi:HAMP domain-containing protein